MDFMENSENTKNFVHTARVFQSNVFDADDSCCVLLTSLVIILPPEYDIFNSIFYADVNSRKAI